MAIPLKYNVRHVFRRWKTTSMTVAAIALVVAVFVSVLSLAQGLKEAFATSGDPENVLVLRNGSTSETNSTVYREDYFRAKFLPAIAQSAEGQPMAVLESLNIAGMEKQTGGTVNAVVRGASPLSFNMRSQITIVEGRAFTPGLNELVVGSGAAKRFTNMKIGDRVRVAKSNWTVVGRFDAGRSAFNSEIWGDVDQINREFDRPSYSSMLLRARTPSDVDALMDQIETNQQLSSVTPRRETEYYLEQTKSSQPIQFLGMLISGIMAVGATFAAMNAMYTSVSGRAQEIATLRVLGFPRRSILVAFCLESLMIGVIGGVVGGLLALPLNGMATGTMSFTTFSEIAFAFRITPQLFMTGVFFAGVVGLIGGFFPALQASRLAILDGLRKDT